MPKVLLGLLAPFLVAATALVAVRKEPLEYFQEMMPVYSHARCMNCHGDVNPSTGDNHDGGVIDAGESCTTSGCHSQADNTNQSHEDDWKIAPSQVAFVGKDAKALCEQMADRVMNFGNQDFMNHLQGDFQIDMGFEGRSGGANSGQPAPPPMSKTDFLVAAARWMDEGFAACDREGNIVHTESIVSDETTGSPGMTTRFEQTGERRVTIRFANGRYRAEIEVKGQTKITQTMRAELPSGPCETVIISTGDYQDSGPAGSAGALGNISAGVGLDVKFQAGGSYTITVRLGPETHRQLDHYVLRDGCGTGLRASPSETLETTWEATRFVIKGKLADPRNRTRLVGRTMRVVTERVSPDDDPWLHDHYAAAAQTGLLHPVTVKTTWNIRHSPAAASPP